MNIGIIKGQISIFDTKVIDRVKKPIQKNNLLAISENNVTQDANSVAVLKKYKSIDNLSRIIKCYGGGYAIEISSSSSLGGFKTIYVNKNGIEDFQFNKKIGVLPMDEILYYKQKLTPNKLQEDKFKIIKEKYKDLKEIRRCGDENIIAEIPGMLISINALGQILEFKNVQATYNDDEVVRNKKQGGYNPGDIVETTYNGEKIVGKIVSEHRLYDAYNISWDNKYSVFHISAILGKVMSI